ncbi:cuscuta receptor 1-like isoform X2 [Carex rostrata]
MTKLLLLVALLVLVLVQWEMSTVSGSDSVLCREEERSALVHINASMSFPIHSLDGKWEGKECCRWERVTCDPTTGHVTQLDLGVFHEHDVFDYERGILLNASMFLPLHQLRSLSLSRHGIYNCTDAAGFESWFNLTKLEMLDLSSDDLATSTVSSLTKVSSLRALYLDYNIFMEGNVPVKELSALNLEVVSLRATMFSGSLPYLGHWSSLKALVLSENYYLSGTLTSKGLCRLKNLEELDLSSNSFSGNLPLCMGNLSSLKLVDLSDNYQLQVEFPSSIFERLTSLRYLSLSYNQLKGTLSTSSFLNHSNLEVLRLSTIESLNFRVEVMNLPFQLQDLELANCILDVEPTFLCSQHKLRVLDLSNTSSKGLLSAMWLLLENNTNLIKLDLHNNFFTGPLQLPFLIHEKLSILDISNNYLSGELPANITTKLPNLLSLALSKNYFQGSLPLMPTRNLQSLDLSSNNLTDDIQNSFLRLQPSIPSFMDLSNNKFYGSFTDNLNFTQASILLLNNNNISGEILFSICNTSFKVLEISNNQLYGGIPDCIGKAELSILKLNENYLEGSLPLEMCAVESLWWLDLSKNKLSGSIPVCSNQSALYIVDMSQNNLTGNFPITWLNISYINILDIRENHLSGELPAWIGGDSNLQMLQASENLFGGFIPEQICQFKYLRILDLSYNDLSGQIPSCITDMGSSYNSFLYYAIGEKFIDFQNVTKLAGELNFSDANFLLHVQDYIFLPILWDSENSRTFGLKLMSKGRLDLYLEEILEIQYLIDLSSNKLVGNIPEDIGRMNWLITLNLSNNHLSSTIPTSVSNLQQLESLDLSHNYLKGKIPRELTKLTSLASFSVAYNDLSGPTLGVEAQFISFDNSSYEGNPNLCGPPLSKSCVPTLGTTQPSPNEMSDNQRYEGTDFLIVFGSFSLFFVVNFWCFMGVLYFKRNWRYALFTLVDWCGDMIYVKVVLWMRKIGTARTRSGN